MTLAFIGKAHISALHKHAGLSDKEKAWRTGREPQGIAALLDEDTAHDDQ